MTQPEHRAAWFRAMQAGHLAAPLRDILRLQVAYYIAYRR
jgi:hypothetical protein